MANHRHDTIIQVRVNLGANVKMSTSRCEHLTSAAQSSLDSHTAGITKLDGPHKQHSKLMGHFKIFAESKTADRVGESRVSRIIAVQEPEGQ